MRTTLPIALLWATISCASAQEFYTFDNNVDNASWPTLVVDEDCAFEQMEVCNDINNALMFTGNYVAAGNVAKIDGPAMWGNPQQDGASNDPYLYLDFNQFVIEDEIGGEFVVEEAVLAVSFDFAWANAAGSPPNPPDLSTLDIGVCDYNGNFDFFSVPILQSFSHGLGGSGEGACGRVTIMADGVVLENILMMEIDLSPVLGPLAEFAIDNFEISIDGNITGGPSDVFPVNSDGTPASNYGTNCLKNQGVFSSGGAVKNGGANPTTFTVQWVPSDPALFQPVPFVMTPIDPGEIVQGALSWSLDTASTPSGEYNGTFTVINDLDPNDPNETIDLFWFRLFDPPILTDNSSAPIDLSISNQATVSNAAAGPHPGALRSSIKVTSLAFDDARFSFSGIAVDDKLDAGAALNASISFNSVGATAGIHSGNLRLQSKMESSFTTFLNRRQPVSDIVWTFQAEVLPKTTESVTVNNGENIGDKNLGISNSNTGVTIIDGISGVTQDVGLAFNGSPAAGGGPAVNTAVDVSFTGIVPIYVLQIRYNNPDVPVGYAEQDLRIEVYDELSMQWVPAISLNSNQTPPIGADPFVGSYADFLAGLGGGSLDGADLSAYGVDPVDNHAWVVLHHASTFRLTVGTSSLPPVILGIHYEDSTNTTTITYQSLPGEAFKVRGNETLLPALTDLPDTAVGDGSVMQYIHNPPGSPSRHFYQLGRIIP